MNFGKWIVVSFISFALFIGVLVAICVRQDVNLVSKNYYQEELKHGEKMQQISNANLLLDQPDIIVNRDQVELHFGRLLEVENGQILFMRPSNSRLDQIYKVESSVYNVQRFRRSDFEVGHYRAQFKWSMEGKDYFYEKTIVI
ncbi:MAG: FixH family protein [Bacteroidia bacterium]|nr:FixH family protein [Bacteroidia bacterium]